MITINYRLKLLHILLYTILFVSCEDLDVDSGKADGRVHPITVGVTDITETTAIVHGDVKMEGVELPYYYYIVSKGFIFGTDSSALRIKSHSYDKDGYNDYYGCFQYYTYTSVSSSATALNIGFRIYEANAHSNDFLRLGSYGEFGCYLTNLKRGTKYYARAFAHVTNDYGDKNEYDAETVNKYLYGETMELITGGITQDPTVFISVDALGIGVMKEDLISTVEWGFDAERYAEEINYDGGVGGYKDWRVPTLNELQEIYKLRTQIGGFKPTVYWSSNVQSGDIYYYYWDFSTNTSGYASLYNHPVGYVRLVRPLP